MHHTSRFTRDATHARVVKKELRRAGVRVLSVTQELTGDHAERARWEKGARDGRRAPVKIDGGNQKKRELLRARVFSHSRGLVLPDVDSNHGHGD